MNEKNKRKRQSVTLDKKWHRRFKIESAKRDLTIETMLDEAACKYLKSLPVIPSV